MSDELQLLQPLLTRILNRRPAPATVWRWANLGVKVGGERVKLRTIKVGGQLYSTVADVEDFIARQNPPTTPTDADGERDPATERRLSAAGLL